MATRRKIRKARFSPLKGPITARTFKMGRVSVSRDAKSPRDFVSIIDAARAFDRRSGFIWGWFAVAYGQDADTGKELTVAVQPKTDLFYHESEGAEFLIGLWETWIEKLANLNSVNFDFRFIRIIMSAAENAKQLADIARHERSEKQKAGHAAAARERQLQAREAAQSKARKTRAENLRRAAQGLPKLPKSRAKKSKK